MLRRRIGEALAGPPPPFFALARPSELSDNGLLDMLRGIGAYDIRRHSTSGVLQFAAEVEPHPSVLVAVANHEDPRRLEFRTRDPERERAVGTFVSRSFVPIPTGATLPVIGAGGGVAVFPTQKGQQVDVVIRRRTHAVSATWRDRASILRGIERQLPPEIGSDERWSFDFGYLELSLYERQEWMRPVFMVTFVASQSGIAPAWARVIVEPATFGSSDFPSGAGLGNWPED